MEKVKLKPCPFCGGKAQMYKLSASMVLDLVTPMCYVTCSRCKIRTPEATLDGAIRLWNHRLERRL